ncbi:hypothetical protein GCM10010121_033710 [Streptomyces brasiliensis]|uniref:Uncharacterized protein n=1 Tax=Streptomyces brasiliensis TaxID=1954 RepID=A0A917NR05_9ACTN|nr:hypothetical protein GCM10010121_033710 [Streptomyces brasiliensis]
MVTGRSYGGFGAVGHAGPLGPLIRRLLLPDPGERPGAAEAAAVLAAVAGERPAAPEARSAVVL